MQNCELVDVLTQPDWVIAIARVTVGSVSTGSASIGTVPASVPLQGYRCWVFTPDFTVLDDGEVHPSREAAAESARRLVIDSREF
ncbi:MAG: hypothetical protein AAF810_26630 [Cyanobacteria bacterium P01_D01_bin.36]